MIKVGDQLKFKDAALRGLYGDGPFEALTVSKDPWYTGVVVKIVVRNTLRGEPPTKEVYILGDYFIRVGVDTPERSLFERLMDKVFG